MKKSKLILSLALPLLLLSGCGSDSGIVASMQKQNVNVDEVFNQLKIDSQGQEYIDMIDTQLLEPQYGYNKNSTIKDNVDKRINDINQLQPGLISQYQAKDAFDLLQKTGTLLSIMKDQYAKEQYIKTSVNDVSLRKLYDRREGETINYSQIVLQSSDFDNNDSRTLDAVFDVTKTIKESKDIKKTFEELARKYPGVNNSNGSQGEVSRDSIASPILKQLDGFKENGHNVEPIKEGQIYYFILRNDDGSRLSFAASKERLTELQYENAKNANDRLSDYYLMLLRNKNHIKFTNISDQNIYNEAQRVILKAYQDAQKGNK